jgi:hypothetical protein
LLTALLKTLNDTTEYLTVDIAYCTTEDTINDTNEYLTEDIAYSTTEDTINDTTEDSTDVTYEDTQSSIQ